MVKTLIHKGYYSKVFLVEEKKKRFILKEFFENKRGKIEDIPVKEIFKREIAGLKMLKKVRSEHVVTPTIIKVNKGSYTQEYVDLIPFNKYVKTHSRYRPHFVEDLMYHFGVYLAQFHKTSKRLHGDLNQKNIGFVDDKVFVFDPAYADRQIHAPPLHDVARFILNWYPYNTWVNLWIRNRDTIIAHFIRGYQDVTPFNRKKLKAALLAILKETSGDKLANTVLYNIKFAVIRMHNAIMVDAVRRESFIWL